MRTQQQLGTAQLDGQLFTTKANFVVHNYCSLLSLMVTMNAFILPRTIHHKVLKVNNESKDWEWIVLDESLTIKTTCHDFDPDNHDPLCRVIKNQTLVVLTETGMKETFTCICIIGFKMDYYHSLEIMYAMIKSDDCLGLFDFRSSEYNPTPRTAFSCIRGILPIVL